MERCPVVKSRIPSIAFICRCTIRIAPARGSTATPITPTPIILDLDFGLENTAGAGAVPGAGYVFRTGSGITAGGLIAPGDRRALAGGLARAVFWTRINMGEHKVLVGAGVG